MTTTIITSDTQALSVAEDIARHLRRDSALRDRERRLPHAELEPVSYTHLTLPTKA